MKTFLEQIQEEMVRTWLCPMIAATIDAMYASGALPLPPLEWGRTEIWYLGDLR